jgi:hypothetical protein
LIIRVIIKVAWVDTGVRQAERSVCQTRIMRHLGQARTKLNRLRLYGMVWGNSPNRSGGTSNSFMRILCKPSLQCSTYRSVLTGPWSINGQGSGIYPRNGSNMGISWHRDGFVIVRASISSRMRVEVLLSFPGRARMTIRKRIQLIRNFSISLREQVVKIATGYWSVLGPFTSKNQNAQNKTNSKQYNEENPRTYLVSICHDYMAKWTTNQAGVPSTTNVDIREKIQRRDGHSRVKTVKRKKSGFLS